MIAALILAVIAPISIAVNDFNQAQRVSDHVTWAIPIGPDWVSESWALFNGSTEIPIQTTVLTHRTNPWLLLDFQASMAQNNSVALTLRAQTPYARHATPIEYIENDKSITVVTGKLKTEISKVAFNLFDGVWWDANSNSMFTDSERLVQYQYTAAPNLSVTHLGVECSGRFRPTVQWEYQGPIRGTLRVDGEYHGPTGKVINYTTRLTWHAGKSYVVVEHVLRNSVASREQYVKLTAAKLSIGSPASWTAITRSGSIVYTNAPTANVGLDLIPTDFVYTDVFGDRGTNTTQNTAANGGMIVGDMSHHGATWVVDFEPGLAGGEQTRRGLVAADPLVVLTEQSRYSQFDSFGIKNMSTWDDEKNAYRRWFWGWPVSGSSYANEPSYARVQTLYPSHRTQDFDTENDELWQNICMFARVQIPYYLDRARSWARFNRWEYAPRTDGFDYDDSWGGTIPAPGGNRSDDFSDDGNGSDNPRDDGGIIGDPSPATVDRDYLDNNLYLSKPTSTFCRNQGLIDWYYLTGDVDALDAAIDIAEKCEQQSGWRVSVGGGNIRAEARQLLVLVRTWEATNNSRWKTAADYVLGLIMNSSDYSTRGFYSGVASGTGGPFEGFRAVVPFFEAEVIEAFYRYYLATGSAAVKARISQMAEFQYANGIDPMLGWCGDRIIIDYPTAGKIKHTNNAEYFGFPTEPYAADESRAFINALVIKYRFTRRQDYLELAKLHWARATRRQFRDAYTTLHAGPYQVGKFVNILHPLASDSETYPEQGYWTHVNLLFSTYLTLPVSKKPSRDSRP